MEYPEEIYQVFSDDMSGSGRRHAYEVGYEAGKAEQSDYIESISSLESVLTDVEQLEGEDLSFVKRLIERTVRAVRAERPDPLAGFSNLTAAIEAGEPIDWERLDGLKAQCVNPDVGTNRGTLERRKSVESDSPDGWWRGGMDYIYVNALIQAWRDEDGWTLWIEGELPLLRKTADQLPLGMCFLGTHPEVIGGVELKGVVVKESSEVDKSVIYSNAFSRRAAAEVEVVEEYGIGTFQGPEGK